MPPRTRKPATDGDKTPAEAAAAEALADNAVDEDGSPAGLVVEFRGEKFTISDEARRSARFVMAVAAGNEPQMIYEMISPEDEQRFMQLARRGESYPDFAVEFFEAYGKASGQGNS